MGRDTCHWVIRRLPLLVGGELLGLERRRVERHVLGCEPCREHQASQERALQALRTLADVEPHGMVSPESVWPDLQRQIEESRRAPRTFGRWRMPPRRWGLAAAAALVLLGGVLAWQIGRHYQLVLGLRPRSSMARVHKNPVFRPTPPPFAERSAASGTSLRKAETDRRELARTPATAGASRDRRGTAVPTN